MEVDEWVDERLNRPEEGHTGAMAIPKTTYLVSHNDSACQNKIHSQAGTGQLTGRPIMRAFSLGSHLRGLSGTTSKRYLCLIAH